MDIRVARAIIKLLGRSHPRVRLILASMANEYDVFLRTQMLEGVAGVHPDTWWKRGKKGLKQAEKYFLDRGLNLDPRWFDLDSTTSLDIVVKEIRRGLRKYKLDYDPYEVIDKFLMGLGITDPEVLRTARPVYEAGKNQAKGILSGLSPNVAANRDLQAYMVRGLDTEAKKGIQRKFEKSFEPMFEDYDVPVESDVDAGDYLLEIIVRQPQDSLGKKIRDFMRKSWAGTGQEPSMNSWLDVVEREKRIPTKKEVAAKVGISEQVFGVHWQKGWRRVFDDLWANQNLLNQLQKRYEMKGLPWFQKKPDPEVIFFRKPRRRASRSDRCEMDIKTARAVLKLLRASNTKDLRVRVAMRWIKANETALYDKMLRAQVLEGAAGVRIGAWWEKGQRGLDMAQDWFLDKGFTAVNPEWFSNRYSGMYGILATAITATARKYGVHLEPLDIIQSSLMGMRADPGAPGHRKESPYYAGENLADKIKDGKETPKSVAGGKLKAYMGRRTSDAAKKKLEQMPEGVEGQEIEIADTRAEEADAGKYLIDIIFMSRSDPLGKKIRDLMRKTWAGTGQERTMGYWLDRAEQERYFPEVQEVAQAVGITPQTFSQRHWRQAWRKFFDALWSDQNLLAQIQSRFESKRIPWFMKKPDPEEIFKIPTRKASDIMVERVTTRWMEGKTDQEITRWFGNPASYPEWDAE